MNNHSAVLAQAHNEPNKLPELNRYLLLENGEEYFPAVLSAIAQAQREILVETFILFEDAVGLQLQSALSDAAARGVSVDLTVDGYGSPDLSDAFIAALTAAGVRLHMYDPRPRLLGIRTNLFRRLHRKIVSVDGSIAFIGGINFGADHLLSFGKSAKQDYAVRIEGPFASDVHRFVQRQVNAFRHRRSRGSGTAKERRMPAFQHQPEAQLVVRDNDSHRDDIERHYRAAIGTARREVVIACAYFFPGYRLLRQLRLAARRGVTVRLILQGAPDVPQARTWATLLYPSLLKSGVQIYEYCARPLHAKVALIDDNWSTIGSSNLDPLSLALNLEANVVIRSRSFNRQLRDRLDPLLQRNCQQVEESAAPRGSLALLLCNFLAYHATRHFPKWAGWLPAHLPQLRTITPPSEEAPIERTTARLGVAGDDYQN